MRVLTGYLPASSGTVKVAGHDVFEEPYEVKRRIGYLPETPPLYPEMSVRGYLRFVASLKGVTRGQMASELDRVAHATGTTEVLERLIQNLSKGFRQRVGLAQALLGEPSGADPRRADRGSRPQPARRGPPADQGPRRPAHRHPQHPHPARGHHDLRAGCSSSTRGRWWPSTRSGTSPTPWARAIRPRWKTSFSSSPPPPDRRGGLDPHAQRPGDRSQGAQHLLHHPLGLRGLHRHAGDLLLLLRQPPGHLPRGPGAGPGLRLEPPPQRIRRVQEPHRRGGGPALGRHRGGDALRRPLPLHASLRRGEAQPHLRAVDDRPGAPLGDRPRQVPRRAWAWCGPRWG